MEVFDRLDETYPGLKARLVKGEKLARVHAPVGVDIAAENPAEIAVSILAEMVNVRRNGPAPHMSDRLRASSAGSRPASHSTSRSSRSIVAADALERS